MSNRLPSPPQPRFGHKGDSDAGAKLVWFASIAAGAAAVLFGAVMMLVGSRATGQDSLGGLMNMGAGFFLVLIGVIFLGAIGFIRKRHGQ